VDVPWKYLNFFMEDDAKLATIGREYGAGRMLTGERALMVCHTGGIDVAWLMLAGGVAAGYDALSLLCEQHHASRWLCWTHAVLADTALGLDLPAYM
jgi:hypothetical protein